MCGNAAAREPFSAEGGSRPGSVLSADVCVAPADGAAGGLADSSPQTDPFQKLACSGPDWRPSRGSEFTGSRSTRRRRRQELSERGEGGSAAQPLATTGAEPELPPCLTGSARPAPRPATGSSRTVTAEHLPRPPGHRGNAAGAPHARCGGAEMDKTDAPRELTETWSPWKPPTPQAGKENGAATLENGLAAP